MLANIECGTCPTSWTLFHLSRLIISSILFLSVNTQNMIDPKERLWAGSGNLLTGSPYTWHITDLDQRRHFSVTYAPPAPVENVEDTEDICMAQLQKHVDQLGDGVTEFTSQNQMGLLPCL